MSVAPREPRTTPTGFVPYGVLGDFATHDLEWQEGALCAQSDPEIFFPEKGGSTREAKSVCRRCLVQAECLDFAVEASERFGIWGGVSERARRRLLGLPEDDDLQEEAA